MTESARAQSAEPSPATTAAGPAPDSPAPAGPAPAGAEPGRVRRAGLVALRPLVMLYLGLGAVQIFLAGLGVFALDGEQLGSADETAFGPHRFVGMLMSGAALLILIAVGLARPGRRIVIMSVVLFLLVFVGQSVLAAAGEDTPLFGGLHAIVGIGSLGLASALLSAGRSRPAGVGGAQQRAAAEASSSA
jgi:hypothetical protein